MIDGAKKREARDVFALMIEHQPTGIARVPAVDEIVGQLPAAIQKFRGHFGLGLRHGLVSGGSGGGRCRMLP